MCHQADEYYSVYDERRRRARKPRPCHACKETIRRGDFYYRVGIVFEREASTVIRCLRCQAIHVHLRRMSKKYHDGETWPDEKLNCGESYRDVWGGEPPAEIAALALLTADEAQAAVDLKATEEASLGR